MDKRIYYSILGMMLFAGNAMAVPAKRIEREMEGSDGTRLNLTLVGDEHYNYYITSDGVAVTEDAAGNFVYALPGEKGVLASSVKAHEASDRQPSELEFIRKINSDTFVKSARRARSLHNVVARKGMSAFPSRGEVRGLVILAEFSDLSFSSRQANADFMRAMNEEGYSDYDASGSARDYFMSQSNGVFQPHFDVVGPVKLPNTQAFYGQNGIDGTTDPNADEMIFDACRQCKDIVDFSKYDYDNNGEVDLVFVVYAGYNEAQGGGKNTVWPHAWDISQGGKILRLNGKKIGRYACTSELKGYEGSVPDGIGTFCHEFSHCLGLPDIYDTNYAGYVGMGAWDLMDAGSYNNSSRTPAGYSAYEREAVGWLEIPELTEPKTGLSLENILEHNEAYKIVSPYNVNEYYTLENRQNVGWDAYLPGHGLLISHIDYDEGVWDSNTVNTPRSGHPHLQIVPANGQFSMLEGAAYPGISGNDVFSHFSYPASTLYTGDILNAPVTDILESDGRITFNFKTYLEAPHALDVENVSENGFTARWEETENAIDYSVAVNSVNTGLKITDLYSDPLKIAQGSTSATQVYPFNEHHTFTLKIGVKGTKSTLGGLKIRLKGTDGKEISSKSVTTRDYLRDELWVFSTNREGYLEFEAADDIELSDLELYNGNVEKDLRAGVVPEPAPYRFSQTFENVKGTNLLIDCVHPGREYIYSVKAHNSELRSVSKSSNKILVKTSGEPREGDVSGVSDAIVPSDAKVRTVDGAIEVIPAEPESSVEIFDASGRLIVKDKISDRKSYRLFSGIYIVKTNGICIKSLLK